MSDIISENSFSTSDNFSESSVDKRVSFRDTVEGKMFSLTRIFHFKFVKFRSYHYMWHIICPISYAACRMLHMICSLWYVSINKYHPIDFNLIIVTSAVDYERRSKQKWMKLSTMDKMQIRLELNKYKMAEMTVHPESLKHNQYYEFPTEITQPMKRHVFQPKLRIVRIGAIRWKIGIENKEDQNWNISKQK